MAPIATVDVEAGTFEAVGQVVSAARVDLLRLAPGDYVYVLGTVVGPGLLYADDIVHSTETYVAGSSEVLVAGIATGIDMTIAQATIGSLVIDYTAALWAGSHPQSEVVVFSGVQPQVDLNVVTGWSFINTN
jgi:hypothetical protein